MCAQERVALTAFDRMSERLIVARLSRGLSITARGHAIFRETTEIIEAEYARDIDVDAAAQRIFTARRQLQRALAEIGGTTFGDYLADVRMSHALELLRRGGRP